MKLSIKLYNLIILLYTLGAICQQNLEKYLKKKNMDKNEKIAQDDYEYFNGITKVCFAIVVI